MVRSNDTCKPTNLSPRYNRRGPLRIPYRFESPKGLAWEDAEIIYAVESPTRSILYRGLSKADAKSIAEWYRDRYDATPRIEIYDCRQHKMLRGAEAWSELFTEETTGDG